MANESERLGCCSTIASAFEKGAHYTPKEEAVYATLTRGIQGTKSFANSNQKTLASWQHAGDERSRGERLGDFYGSTDNRAEGDSPSFSPTIRQQLLDCLPCSRRILSNLTLNPLRQFIDIMLFDLRNRLNWLKEIENILGEQSLNTYADLCGLLHFLNRMCLVDLQALLWLLSMLHMDIAINLDGLIPMLRSLIAPLIAPPLASLNNILEQITQLILAPLDCMIEALDIAIRDLNVIDATGETLASRWRQVVNTRDRLEQMGAQHSSAHEHRSLQQRMAEDRLSLQRTVAGEPEHVRRRGEIQTDTLGGQIRRTAAEADAEALAAARRSVTTVRTLAVAGDVVVDEAEHVTTGAVRAMGTVVNQRGVVQSTLEASGHPRNNNLAIQSGLVELRRNLIVARQTLEDRLFFYRKLLAQLTGQWKALDDEYAHFSINKLVNIRLISLVLAIIKAKASGRALCEPEGQPTEEELTTWLDAYVNPNSPFNIAVDKEGNLFVAEKAVGRRTLEPTIPRGQEGGVSGELPNTLEALGLSSDPLAQGLVSLSQIRFPCRLTTTTEDAARLNRWMEELNRIP